MQAPPSSLNGGACTLQKRAPQARGFMGQDVQVGAPYATATRTVRGINIASEERRRIWIV